MKESTFQSTKQNKSAMDSDPADSTATETLEKTSKDDWKSKQQKVSSKSPNLYMVTDNPEEKAMTGDGYSVKNGKVNDASSSAVGAFFANKPSGTMVSTVAKKLKVVEHPEPGLVMSAGSAPELEQLVKEDEEGCEIKMYKGTVEDPNVSKDVSDKYLFANGGPDQNDVKQVGVGDCYFWGAVLQILAHDPNKFASMMKLKGSNVETTMYHKSGRKWVATTITRPMGIGGLNSQYTKNDFYQNECGVRVDTSAPCESAWNAVMSQSICLINRKDYYKAALWANCLEQAYSDFSREYGKYGAGAVEEENSGNEEFVNGCSDSCMQMFYGKNAKGPGTFAINDDSTQKTIKALIEFKKGLEGTGSYTALVARRTHGDPNSDSAHAYSVQNVTFCDKNGKTIDFSDNTGLLGFISDSSERKSIDTSKSKILFRNPWNSTDSEEGKFFEVSLEKFLTSDEWTHLYQSSVSKRTSEES